MDVDRSMNSHFMTYKMGGFDPYFAPTGETDRG